MSSSLQPERVRRLLVRGTNWVGDAVISLPALRRVRQVFRGAQISLLVLPWVSGIYEGADYIDEILIYDREGVHRGARGRLGLVRSLRKAEFDAALLLQNAFEAAFLAWLAGIPLRAGYSRDGRGWLLTHPIPIHPHTLRLHQSYYYLDLIDQLTQQDRVIFSAPLQRSGPDLPLATQPDISLQVSSTRRQAARSRLQQYGIDFSRKLVGVNPGAFFGSAKRWPSECYGGLLDRLLEKRQAQVVVFGSPNETTIAQQIRAAMRHEPILLTGKTQLSELIAMIACCDAFVTNDSGPMHLAAALRVPTLAIFGPTDEIATGPLSPTAVVLNKKVECSPCLLRECPIDHRCMKRITVDEVYERIVRMLNGTGLP
jgi:lipopolysaccharide heptosyltransferase II